MENDKEKYALPDDYVYVVLGQQVLRCYDNPFVILGQTLDTSESANKEQSVSWKFTRRSIPRSELQSTSF